MTDQEQRREDSSAPLTPKGPDDAADTQAELSREMAEIAERYDASGSTGD